MEGAKRSDIQEGMQVKIVLKKDQRSGQLTEGVVDKILTNSPTHHYGIKVRLEDGQVEALHQDVFPPERKARQDH